VKTSSPHHNDDISTFHAIRKTTLIKGLGKEETRNGGRQNALRYKVWFLSIIIKCIITRIIKKLVCPIVNWYSCGDFVICTVDNRGTPFQIRLNGMLHNDDNCAMKVSIFGSYNTYFIVGLISVADILFLSSNLALCLSKF
jgi:hypothetical protein